jgi:hypothetical protein
MFLPVAPSTRCAILAITLETGTCETFAATFASLWPIIARPRKARAITRTAVVTRSFGPSRILAARSAAFPRLLIAAVFATLKIPFRTTRSSALAAILPVKTRTVFTLRPVATIKARRPCIAAFATWRIWPLLAELLVTVSA